jgi:hypothetical protein
MGLYIASRARALAAAASVGAALAMAASAPAGAAVGDFAVSGPASFPAPVAVGQSAVQTYTVTNHTASAWEFGGIGYPPAGLSDLSWTVENFITCPSGGTSGAIAAGESCTIGLHFAPNAAGTHSINFQLNFFPPEGGFAAQANIVTVTASAYDVALGLSPSGGLTFPDQALDSIGAPRAVTVSALRPSTAVGSVRVTGDALNDFVISNDGCSGVTLVAAGDQCTIWLRSAPTALGARSASLVVRSGPETETVGLAGNGVPPAPGPQGETGATGATGATGPAGPAGPAGKVVCRSTALARVTCELLFAPGTWKTAGAATATRARYTISRGHKVVARGSRRLHGRPARLVLRVTRHLRPGRYRVAITVGRRSFTRTVTVR